MRLKKKHINTLKKLSPIGTLIQISLWREAEKFFGVRSNLNEEIATYLKRDKKFNAEIRDIQTQFKIPSLNPNHDFKTIQIEYEGRSVDIEVHDWLESLPPAKREMLEKTITDLIQEYKLPLNFYDWVQDYLLYGKPSYIPSYNFELINQVINHVDEIERFVLTTQEKKFILACFKGIVGNNPQIPKPKFRQAYRELKEILKRSKNIRRRFRTLDTALKTRKMGQIEHRFDFARGLGGEEEHHKVTSTDLATRIFNDNTGKRSQVVRKQKQRLKERARLLLHKK